MISAPPKRFYAAVALDEGADGFTILLDSKPVRTPAKAVLALPGRALAGAVAAEWEAQRERIEPATMPLTRLASIAIDLVMPRRDDVVAAIANYATTDLVCYRADHPPELVRRQHHAWQPLVQWIGERFGAPLEVVAGVLPRAQPDASLRTLVDVVAAYDSWTLAALNLATTACGSLVVALALAEGLLDAGAAFAAAELERSFEIEQWGEDAEQTQRRQALREDIAGAAHFLELLRA